MLIFFSFSIFSSPQYFLFNAEQVQLSPCLLGGQKPDLPLSLFHPYLGGIIQLEKRQDPRLVGWGMKKRLSKACQWMGTDQNCPPWSLAGAGL